MNILEPCHDFKDLTEDISVASNLSCSFQLGQEKIFGTAEIQLNFCPRPATKIIVECDFEVFKHYNSILHDLQCITVNDHKIPVFSSYISPPTSGKTKISFDPKSVPFSLTGDKNTQLSKVIFHLFNFKDEIGTNTKKIPSGEHFSLIRFTELASNEWKIELYPYKSSESESNSVLQLTHVGCLTKSNKSMFDGGEAHKILANLHWFFYILSGRLLLPRVAGWI